MKPMIAKRKRKFTKREREQLTREHYSRACAALSRMTRVVDDKLDQLYYAMQRRDEARAYYDKWAKRLASRDR